MHVNDFPRPNSRLTRSNSQHDLLLEQFRNRVGQWVDTMTSDHKSEVFYFINTHVSLFLLIPMLLIRSKAPSRLRKCVSPFEPVIIREEDGFKRRTHYHYQIAGLDATLKTSPA